MMGFQFDQQPKLFYPTINLEQRVPEQHLLSKIKSRIDFNFIYGEVRECYGIKGNVSVPPPVILRMMLLLVLYNVRSERELMGSFRGHPSDLQFSFKGGIRCPSCSHLDYNDQSAYLLFAACRPNRT